MFGFCAGRDVARFRVVKVRNGVLGPLKWSSCFRGEGGFPFNHSFEGKSRGTMFSQTCRGCFPFSALLSCGSLQNQPKRACLFLCWPLEVWEFTRFRKSIMLQNCIGFPHIATAPKITCQKAKQRSHHCPSLNASGFCRFKSTLLFAH